MADTVSQTVQLPASTVTARMEQEDPKEVPISLSVISGEQLRTQRLDTLESALRNTSGVSVNSSGGPNDFNVLIRGVGSLYQMSMDDSSVAFNIDGVPVSSRSLGFETLDVDRIEVLKGPQGTLSGAIGQAGAVNITTRQPTRELEGYVRGEVGQQGQFLTEGAVGGPLTDNVSGRLAVRRAGYDSWIDNDQTHHPPDQTPQRSVPGQPAVGYQRRHPRAVQRRAPEDHPRHQFPGAAPIRQRPEPGPHSRPVRRQLQDHRTLCDQGRT
ncbi:TonB-dependent receptor plug domain-containing protein [Pseudomonas proteolytica]|nr:TonB-dependent receptor plug domain-containing protein [Pseudomonas proteolytica]